MEEVKFFQKAKIFYYQTHNFTLERPLNVNLIQLKRPVWASLTL